MDGRLPPSFAALLRTCRQTAGLTQEELAERAGLSRRSIGDIERGVSMAPRRETVALLAGALELSDKDRTAFLNMALRRRVAIEAPVPFRAATVLPFVGRRHETMLLDRFLAGTSPPFLVVAGEPGIGKTRLLRLAAARANELGFTILEGSCNRRSDQEPFAPILTALAKHVREQTLTQLRTELRECAWLQRMLPELAELGYEPQPVQVLPPSQERRLMCDAVVRFLRNVAGSTGQVGRRGVLLVLDDLQWAGSDALDLLALLARAQEPSRTAAPLLVLGAYRDTEVGPSDHLSGALADLAQAALVARLLVPPLSTAEASQLVQELAGERLTGEARDRIVQRGGGVPHFLMALAQERRSDAASETAGNSGWFEQGIPWELAQGIRSRVAAMPESVQSLLRVVAVAGRAVTCEQLAHVTSRSSWAVAEQVVMACRAQLLSPQGSHRYGFKHDLIREAVLADYGVAWKTPVNQRLVQVAVASPKGMPDKTEAVDPVAYAEVR